MSKHTPLDLVALVLMIVGSLNSGLAGVLNYDVITSLLGAGSVLSKIVSGLIGLSGLYGASWLVKKD